MKLGFADRLHHALKDRGISSFLDVEELPKGDDVRKCMLEAARGASFRVPIFTNIYGTSEWCLDELVEMMDSKRNRKAKVIPVFFDLKSEELRTEMESGQFAQNFRTFLQTCTRGEERIKQWKHALEEASWLEGFRLETYGGREGALIGALVKKICDEIFDSLPVDAVLEPVGLDVKVQDVLQRLCLHEKRTVHIVLVWGMGGVGKTTLARAIYHRHKKDFEEASFVANCGDQEPIQIQDRLRKDLLRDSSDMASDIYQGRAVLRNGLEEKKVLIILDDVKDYFNCVENVLNLSKLCPGSRIVLTSRDQGVFPHVNDFSDGFRGDRYGLQTMDKQESLQLFCYHAFRRPSANPGFENLATEVVKACDGLPLSLEVLGRYLSTFKEKKQWREAVTKLRDNTHKDISGRLMISYEALDDDEKQMFEDVACFLIGEYERRAKYFWDASIGG